MKQDRFYPVRKHLEMSEVKQEKEPTAGHG